jgi:cell division protein FtsB
LTFFECDKLKQQKSEVEAELKGFTDKENALTQLAKTLNVNDLAIAKQQARYAEELRLVT